MRALLPLLALIAACGNIETTPVEDPSPAPLPPSDGLLASGEGFDEDPYTPGSRWYIYDGTTHSITPRPELYAARRGDAAWLVRIKSYYDAQGRSGVVSMELRERGAAGWSAWSPLTTSANVQEQRVCIDLDARAEAPCDDAEIALRIDWRVVPPAGFAVANPAIYALAHHSDPAPLSLAIIPASSLDDAADDAAIDAAIDAATPAADAARDLVGSRVGWLHDRAGLPPRRDVQLQATANMELVQWQVDRVDGLTITLNARCAPLSATPDAQVALSEYAANTLAVTLPPGDQSGVYVRLCGEGAGEVGPITAARAGLWPDTKTFDLIVEQVAGRVAIRPAPGDLLHSWTRGAGAGADVMDPAPTPPAQLWE
jgi:hypothetical protein